MADNYIFGYGSLINSDSRAATAGKPVPAVPVRVSGALGLVRAWNFRSKSGFTALGLRPARGGESQSINGVVYKVEGTMEAFDTREVGYRRVEVTRDTIAAVSGGLPSPPAQIWVYVPDELHPPDAGFPLLQSYIDVCVVGALEHGEEFAREFVATTDGWSDCWLNDRLLARRPWVHQPKHGAVDGVLNAHAPSHTDHRQFSEDYAARFGRK